MEYAHVSYNTRNGEEECSGTSDGRDEEQEAFASTAEGDRAEGGGGPVGKQGFVYFIETEDGRFVKIGYSMRPNLRVGQLGTSSIHRLRLIGWMPGTLQTERWLHAKFSDDRDRGEWFRNSEQLRQFIGAMGLIRPVAESVVLEDVELMATKKKNAAAVSLGSLGGKARKKNLTPEERSEIARKGGIAGGRGRKKE